MLHIDRIMAYFEKSTGQRRKEKMADPLLNLGKLFDVSQIIRVGFPANFNA